MRNRHVIGYRYLRYFRRKRKIWGRNGFELLMVTLLLAALACIGVIANSLPARSQPNPPTVSANGQ